MPSDGILVPTEVTDFAIELSKLSRAYGIIIEGPFRVVSLDEDEIVDADYYGPAGKKRQTLEWGTQPTPLPIP